MEEITLQQCKNRARRRLSRFVAQHRGQAEVEQARIVAKLNSCFSSHHEKKPKMRQPLQPLKELAIPYHLRKNNNKIQQNISRHQDIDLRGTVARLRDFPKKTQIIVNKTFYHQYFTPKTQEEIIVRHRDALENEWFEAKDSHKSPLTSLHVESDEGYTTVKQPMLLKNSKKRFQHASMRRHDSQDSFKEPSMLFSSCQGLKAPNKEISRYNKQELQGYYHSLSQFSRGNPKKYKEGLETMLNLMNVPCNEKILTQEFNKYKANPSLQQFLNVYTKIVDAALRQNVMDFFDIIFEDCGTGQLDKQKLTFLLSERMRAVQAAEIVDEIFYLIAPEARTVSTADILTLCCTNDEFCWFMRQFSILDTRKK